MSYFLITNLEKGFIYFFIYFFIRDRDQSNQSSSTSSVYGRLIRGVLGFKALLRAFFVKP